MGNTGNAVTTSPHLHFGIYTSAGAIDPLNHILIKDTIPGKLKTEVKYLGKELMITDNDRILPVNILAVSTNNITYQDFKGKHHHKENLNINNQKIRLQASPNSLYLLDTPGNEAIPVGKFNPKESYSVLGSVNNFLYLEQKNVKGWALMK
jgi:murein DD-endopeptidase MepM/ murein hydrolase activator NlpD